jgi:hypothetical protein
MRHWAVKVFAELTMLAGFLLMVPGLIFAVVLFTHYGDPGTDANRQLAAIAAAVAAFLVGLPLMALGQLLLCIVAIEKNTNSTASFLETIANRNDSGQATPAQ